MPLSANQRSFLKAFSKTRGNISEGCKAAGISRTAYYMWLVEEEFKIAFEEAEEAIGDRAEQTLGEAAGFDWKAAVAYLERRRAKKWNQRVIEQDHGVDDRNEPLPVVIMQGQEKLDKPIK